MSRLLKRLAGILNLTGVLRIGVASRDAEAERAGVFGVVTLAEKELFLGF